MLLHGERIDLPLRRDGLIDAPDRRERHRPARSRCQVPPYRSWRVPAPRELFPSLDRSIKHLDSSLVLADVTEDIAEIVPGADHRRERVRTPQDLPALARE